MSTSIPTPSRSEEERRPWGAASSEPGDGARDHHLVAPLGHGALDDVRASGPVDRLLEDSWEARSAQASRREVVVESIAAAAFLVVAGAMAARAVSTHHIDLGLTALLVALYALVAGTVRFPHGAGYVVPTYVMLVPMLLLLPPGVVPLLTATGLVIASLGRWAARHDGVKHVLFAIPNAWHSVAPAGVLLLAGQHHGSAVMAGVYVGAFVAGCLLDLGVSLARESFSVGVAANLQLRVVLVACGIDACIAPLGLMLEQLARSDHLKLLMVLPLSALLLVLDRDRTARIDQAQRRLELVGRERTRLQGAVRRLGEAFAAKLDLESLAHIALSGTTDALDADAGLFTLGLPHRAELDHRSGDPALEAVLRDAAAVATESGGGARDAGGDTFTVAVTLEGAAGVPHGAVALARRARPFREDEQALMAELIERAETAIREILEHETFREQAVTDPLTQLGNRRRLVSDLTDRLNRARDTDTKALVLMVFDLDGFKQYNDTFGHPAGDALLSRLGGKLTSAVEPCGVAYRLGGDEFCALITVDPADLRSVVDAASAALREQGDDFSVRASCGAVLLPHEAATPDYALQLADERMYANKQTRGAGGRTQARDMLLQIMKARQPGLSEHSSGVAELAVSVGRRLNMTGEQIDELHRAAELHDVGKVGVPDAILEKPGPLDPEEWKFIHQHPILGERILNAEPALRPVARIVRAHHERWDGAGYPDRLVGETIPLAARIIAVCDAYHAITNDRSYRHARSPEQARAELLAAAGRQFDPEVVAAVLNELDVAVPWGETAVLPSGRGLKVDDIADYLLHIMRAPAAEAGPAAC